MEKDKSIFIGIIVVLLSFLIMVSFHTVQDKKEEPSQNSDALLFKKEYEALNNIVRDKDGKTIKELSIPNTNPVDILTEEDALTFLKTGTGILYFGFADCPWCRSLLPVLLKTLENTGIDRLYYLNVSTIRDTLVLDEENKVEVKEQGSKGYYEILKVLDGVLKPYYLTSHEGTKIDTKEKRLYAPTLIFVKEGQIVAIHEGTLASQENGYDDLSLEQEEELSQILIEKIQKVYALRCNEAC